MGCKLCVGNLGDDVSDEGLARLFSPYGRVEQAKVAVHPKASRGTESGWVQMGSDSEAEAALKALDGSECQGRTITVWRPHPGPRPGEFGDRGGAGPCEPGGSVL